MQKSAWAIIGIVACVPIAWGSLTVREHFVCSGLEEDYLNIVSSLTTMSKTKALMTQLGKPVDGIDSMMKNDEKQMEAKIQEMFAKCGERATSTAIRKSTQILSD